MLRVFTATFMSFLVCTDVYLCVFFVCVSELLSSLFARGYREAGRKQSGTGGVMETEENEEGGKKKRKGDRQIDGGHAGGKKGRIDSEGNRQTSRSKRKRLACVHTNMRTQTTGVICRLFLFACLSSTSIPSSLPQQVLLSSRSLFSPSVLPSPTPPRFYAFSSFSCSSLQYTVPGGDSSKSNCLSISHQCTASRGSCPLKTMKVGLSAEPGIRFNYINKELC